MALCMSRFNMIDPEGDGDRWADRYRAMLDMAEYIDQNGFAMISLEEHHGAENGWSPTPMLNAGMIMARTKNLGISISALLLPLHDPIRVAEDLAVLDLVSGGRVITIAGLGYRPSEYKLHNKEWTERGKIMDRSVETLLKAWTGEPFEYNGETVQVRPVPVSKPHPTLLIGGTSKFAARRAARFGLPLFPAKHLPELEAYYYEQCTEHGTQGFCMMPGEHVSMLFVSEDPDKTWAELGHHFLHEAALYASWQTPDIQSSMKSAATTVDELRAEGIYSVRTPDECIEIAMEQGQGAQFTHHPLCGGMPIDAGWASLQLFVDKVVPHLGA